MWHGSVDSDEGIQYPVSSIQCRCINYLFKGVLYIHIHTSTHTQTHTDDVGIAFLASAS